MFNLKTKNPFKRERAKSIMNREERKSQRNVQRICSSSVNLNPLYIYVLQFFEEEEMLSHGYLKVEIIDTGLGISLKNIQKLFQPFVQTHPIRKHCSFQINYCD